MSAWTGATILMRVSTSISALAMALAPSIVLAACGGSNPGDPAAIETPSGDWTLRAPLIEPNSELALAESNGKLYLLGGYPATRQTARTVQVYDIATDSWQLGPPLPQPNNHGMAASVNGKI